MLRNPLLIEVAMKKTKLMMVLIATILLSTACDKNNKNTFSTTSQIDSYVSENNQENYGDSKESVSFSPINDEKTETKYPLEVSIGDTCSIDLDGDSVLDNIYYDIDKKNNITSISINNVNYVDSLSDFDLDIVNPSARSYYIVDIDTSDNYKELALMDCGNNNNKYTLFFRYSDNMLEFIGSITDFSSSLTCSFLGDGTITAANELSVLKNLWAPMDWSLTKYGYLDLLQEPMYYSYDNKFALLQDLPLYLEQNKDSDTTTIPKGSKCRIVATDNKHWVLVKCSNDMEGWIYMKDKSHIMIHDKSVFYNKVFGSKID